MKILVISQYYYPESFRINDICEDLVKQGHKVTVVSGVPNYPRGKIFPGYGYGRRKKECVNGVDIRRCFTIGRRNNIVFRFLNYYSYMISSTMYCSRLSEKFDAVFVYQVSPVLMANAANKYSKKNGVPLILYCLDVWPEILLVSSVKRDSLIYKYFYKVSMKIYSKADKVLVTSESFRDYFYNKFSIKNVEYLPQYAESIFDYKKCFKEPNDTVDLMFAGNIGIGQSVETIVEAARLTQDCTYLKWHIVGDGSQYEKVKKLADGLPNIFFYGLQPLDKMPEFYSKADALIVSFKKDSVLEMTLPGKVQSYMAAGKPIIASADGECRKLIESTGCGYCCDAEDAAALADAAKRFANETNKTQFSEKSYNTYNALFSKDAFMQNLNRIFDSVAE